MSETKRLTRAFSEVLDARTNPADDWVSVGQGFLSDAIDHMEWLDNGIAEWRGLALTRGQHLAAVQATARVAIGHLQAVLNKPRTHDEQQRADTAARDWLASIGSEPT